PARVANRVVAGPSGVRVVRQISRPTRIVGSEGPRRSGPRVRARSIGSGVGRTRVGIVGSSVAATTGAGASLNEGAEDAEMTDMIDPVAQPSAYQTMLLDLLRDRDPASVQAATPAALRSLVNEAGPHLRERPEPGEWSVLELIG